MIRRPPRSTHCISSAASDVYKRQKYNSRAFTTIIKHDKITNNTALQIFTREGPLAFLPISNNETSIVFSLNNYRL